MRRIEALTGTRRAQARAITGAAREGGGCRSLKCASMRSPARLAQLLDERKRLERELADAKKKLAMGGGAGATAPTACAWSATSS